MLNYMRSQKIFTQVGSHAASGTVWGIYTDGVLYAVLNNVDFGPVTGRSQESKPKPKKQPKVRGRDSEYKMLIAEPQWRQLNLYAQMPATLDYPHVTDPIFQAQQMFELAKTVKELGSTVVGMSEVTDAFTEDPLEIQNLKDVSGDGVFYYTGYGAYIPMESKPLSVLASSTPVVTANRMDDALKADLDARRLVILSCPFMGPGGSSDIGWGNRYGFTEFWVDHYNWTFPSESIVFLNASFTVLWEDVFTTRGVNTFMAWERTLPVRRQLAVGKDLMHLFLGTDWREGSVTTIADEPPLRNAGLREAVDYLYSEGFLSGEDLFGGEASFFVNAPRNAELVNQMRPAIEYITVDELREEISIQGQLGPSEFNKKVWISGSVPLLSGLLETADGRISGTDLRTTDWDTILGKADLSGFNGGGYVQVKAGNLWSNAVPLTAYRATFRVVLTTAGTLTIDATVEVTFRGMMQGYRLKLNEDPLDMWSTVLMTNALDARVNWTASGSASQTVGNTTTELTWSGNGLISARNSSTSQSISFATSVDLRSLRGTLVLGILDSVGFKETRRVTTNGNTTTTESNVAVSLANKPEWGIPGAPTAPLGFDQRSFDLIAGGGSYDTTGYNRFGRTGKITASWIQTEIDTPPLPDLGQR